VVCQFGVMFFPDRSKAYAEIRRVLKPGGVFIFNVWDRLDSNAYAEITTRALESMFPNDPPRFLPRTPYGYNDPEILRQDLAKGGFTASPEIIAVPCPSSAASCEAVAIGYCQGTPLRGEIEARGGQLSEATKVVAEALGKKYGAGTVNAQIQAVVVTVQR